MRTTILALAAVALVASACAGGASSVAPSQGRLEPVPQHHQPTPPPWPDHPAPSFAPQPQDPLHDPQDPSLVEPSAVDPREDRVSTFALDVDTASYRLARRAISEGIRPDPSTVRVEEWVNAFEHAYPAPDEDAFAIVTDGGTTPFLAHDERLLRIGIRAADVVEHDRAEASLTFVIDTSGSMERDGRLELVQDALATLVRGLGQRDRVSIVTFGDDGRVILPPTRASETRRILDAIGSLRPGGSTNLEEGLRLGYGLAREALTENGIDRVVLASDGVANVGLIDPDGLLQAVRDDAEAGIELVSVGVGMGDYNDELLERLADDGDGFYAYVDDRDEAYRLFTEDLTGSLQAVALDARVQVEWDRQAVAAYRLLGYENRAIADQDFTDDRVPAGAIGAGHDVTALYVVRLDEAWGLRDPLATVRLRWTDPARGGSRELAVPVWPEAIAASWRQVDPTLRLDAIVAAAAEAVRDEPWSGAPRLTHVAEVARQEADRLPPTDEVHGFLRLLEALAWMEE